MLYLRNLHYTFYVERHVDEAHDFNIWINDRGQWRIFDMPKIDLGDKIRDGAVAWLQKHKAQFFLEWL